MSLLLFVLLVFTPLLLLLPLLLPLHVTAAVALCRATVDGTAAPEEVMVAAAESGYEEDDCTSLSCVLVLLPLPLLLLIILLAAFRPDTAATALLLPSTDWLPPPKRDSAE